MTRENQSIGIHDHLLLMTSITSSLQWKLLSIVERIAKLLVYYFFDASDNTCTKGTVPKKKSEVFR